jgi:hypothetical protein
MACNPTSWSDDVQVWAALHMLAFLGKLALYVPDYRRIIAVTHH